jgi:hypothetical protein
MSDAWSCRKGMDGCQILRLKRTVVILHTSLGLHDHRTAHEMDAIAHMRLG